MSLITERGEKNLQVIVAWGCLRQGFCKTVKERRSGIWRRAGLWTGYWWPKPGETVGSRKLTYHLSAEGTSYLVSSGIIP